MATSSWLIGSIVSFGNQTISVDDGGGATSAPMTFSYDGTYLEHPTTGLSMLKTLEAAITAAGTWTTAPEVFLSQDGKVRITAEPSFSITWTSSGTALRDALGFSGDLLPNTSHTASDQSSLLWVPRRNESPRDAPLGVVGDSAHAVSQVVAPDGTQATREFGSPVRRNSYTWHYIDKDQFWTSAEADGELFSFVRDVCVPGAKFFLYRQTDATYTATTEVTLGSSLGPYEHTDALRSLALVRSAGFERTDCKYDWTARVLSVSEYST